MKLNPLFSMTLLCFGTSALAAIPSGFDAQKWATLQVRVVQIGSTYDAPNGVYVTASEIVPDIPHQPHHADYLSLVGGTNSNGTFVAGHVENVSEDWQIDAAGDWDVDQWLFVIETSGDVAFSRHYHLVENLEGDVVLHDRISATDAEGMAAWETRLCDWYTQLKI